MVFLEACAMGNLERIERLLEKGVDVNTTGTPSSPDVLSTTSGLMMAAMSNQVEVVERLVKLDNLNINMRGMQENTALTFAAGQGYKDIVLILLRSGADSSVTNSSGKSSLGLAATHCRMESFIDICNQLVGAGCTGTDKDWDVLTNHPRRKLVVMMEVLRTAKERMSLRFLARKQVLETVIHANVGKNPGSCIDLLEIPRNVKQYLKHPI
eukprot:TRINITY_DN10709_c0_g1_i1.p1 TRINITY_DN10709_c0_g1~~TRINITY_DN10709_c0_g1_i1.p1  ORF type:complete len:211 (-),score=44.24 TRINITY_DN10709_c0_g1_i1:106-738(-)